MFYASIKGRALVNRLKLCTAVMFGLVLTASVAPCAAAGPQWPNAAVDEPQWPNIRPDDIDAPRVNQRPTFVDPEDVEDRIMGRKRGTAPKPRAASTPT